MFSQDLIYKLWLLLMALGYLFVKNHPTLKKAWVNWVSWFTVLVKHSSFTRYLTHCHVWLPEAPPKKRSTPDGLLEFLEAATHSSRFQRRDLHTWPGVKYVKLPGQSLGPSNLSSAQWRQGFCSCGASICGTQNGETHWRWEDTRGYQRHLSVVHHVLTLLCVYIYIHISSA